MDEAERKLVNYLVSNFGIWELLELWEQVSKDMISADEIGVADYMVYTCGADEIFRILSKDLIPKLASGSPREQEEALKQMEEMGFEL